MFKFKTRKPDAVSLLADRVVAAIRSSAERLETIMVDQTAELKAAMDSLTAAVTAQADAITAVKARVSKDVGDLHAALDAALAKTTAPDLSALIVEAKSLANGISGNVEAIQGIDPAAPASPPVTPPSATSMTTPPAAGTITTPQV